MADLKLYDIFDMEIVNSFIRREGIKRVMEKGECFCRMGCVADSLAVVDSGVFAFTHPDYKGDSQILSFASADELIGSVISVPVRRSCFDVIALCRSEIAEVSAGLVSDFLDSQASGLRVLLYYAIAYGFMVRGMSYRCESPEMRYRELLIRNPDIAEKVSMTAIASYLGVTRETFARMRTKMKKT